MKVKRRAVVLILLTVAMLLTGCQSILLDADLKKATVAMHTVPVTVPDKVTEAADENMNLEKYEIKGMEAFYIFPAHQPAPEQIIDFKVLDLIDGNTTVYAYQAMYTGTDEAGLGGAPETGIATDSGKEEKKGTASDRMETVLMSYNIQTKEYHVFFHRLDPYDGSGKKTWNSAGSATGSFDAEENDTGENGSETGHFFTQKVGTAGENYFFFYKGVGRVFDRDGRMAYERDITSVLDYNTSRYGGEGAVLTLTNVVADQNNFMYVLMNIEKKGSSVDENTTEEDLGEEDNGTVQLLYSCFKLNVGEPYKSDLKEDEKRYFITENKNYDKQIEMWKNAVDGKTFTIDGFTAAPEGEVPSVSEEEVPSVYRVRYRYRDTYDTYRFYDPVFNLKLFRYIVRRWDFGILRPSDYYDYQWLEAYASLEGVNPFNIELYSFGDRYIKYVGYIPDGANDSGNGTKCILAYGVFPAKQSANAEEVTRTYTVKWKSIEAETYIKDGIETERYKRVEHSEEVEEKALFYRSYEVRFKGNVIMDWSIDRYTSDMIAPSAGTGLVRYGTIDPDREGEYSFAEWAQNNQVFRISGIQGKAANVELITEKGPDETFKPYLILFTSKEIAVSRDFASKDRSSWVPNDEGTVNWHIKNAEVNFGLTMGESGVTALNDLKIPEVDQKLNVSDNDSMDVYNSQTVRVQEQGGKTWLYLAGVNNGLVKYNLSAGSSDQGKCGQVSPYPYYGIWLNDDGKSCYAIGYQTSEFAYAAEDICRAKLYRIDLQDFAAASNLVVSALAKDQELRKAVLSKTSGAWGRMLENLGIAGADLSQVNLYQEFLTEGENKKATGIQTFYNLAGLSAAQRTKETEVRLLACNYAADLEALMASLRPELAGKAEVEPPILSGSGGTAGDTSRRDMELTGKDVEIAMNEQEKVISNRTDIALVTESLRQTAGMTAEVWNDTLNEIIYDIQIPDTMEEFNRKRAVRQFALMAGIGVQKGLETKIKNCETAAELENLMAEYNMEAADAAVLQDIPDPKDETKLKEYADAKAKRQEAVVLCRQEYVHSAYTLDGAGEKEYLSNRLGSSWNSDWQQTWNRQINEILIAFRQ